MSETDCPTFYGKYRGTVEVNFDPLGLGRVQVSVPDVLGDETMAWAMPCLPGAGPGVGLFTIPPEKANVWVEFERGDPDYPIWSGGFWGLGDAPATLGPTQQMTHVWAGDQFRLELMDAPGLGAITLSITTAAGEATLTAESSAMTLKFAGNTVSLAMDGVSINGSNLKVMK